jgi:hypothetical protein
MARCQTRSVRCAHYAQTMATSQLLKRAARAATSPALLGASQARHSLPARAFAGPVVASGKQWKPARASPLGATRRCLLRSPPPWLRGRWCLLGAILWRREAQDFRRRAQRASTTDSAPLSECSERSERSELATRLKSEHRSAVGVPADRHRMSLRRTPPAAPPRNATQRNAASRRPPSARKHGAGRPSNEQAQRALPAFHASSIDW